AAACRIAAATGLPGSAGFRPASPRPGRNALAFRGQPCPASGGAYRQDRSARIDPRRLERLNLDVSL
ncbi:hypothetical protein, partial [Burkholderia glumae]|uniref:hypothetical protein n=1 Tax=Burkholderia glumae TaxID=337 RepID=UPI0005BCF659